jgi:hypothetical protein
MKRYYTVATTVPIAAKQSESGKELEINVTLGLVGFHIAHKTKGQPQWVWSTFEHVDNLAAPPGDKPTFNDPGCANCAANNRPLPPNVSVPAEPDKPDTAPKEPYLWSESPPYARSNQRIPTQIQRTTAIKAQTTSLNQEWQQALRNASSDSVWQYYQLISTQWPTKPFARQPGQLPGAGADNPTVAEYEGEPAPAILANVPLETYNQQTSSCIVCHSRAFTTNGDYADFSYLLQLAR